MDLLGYFLRETPGFRGKGRLINYWLKHSGSSGHRRRTLPGNMNVDCDLSIPYEAMVWLEAEEERDLQTLKLLLKPGQFFLDCGANLGLWTLVAAAAVGQKGKVTALEPNPSTFEKLVQNVKANGLTMVEPLRVAAGEKEGVLPLRCEREHNISRLVERADDSTIMVPIVPLDEIAGGRVVDGLKIDVEGHELPVLKGARNILESGHPWLAVEFNALLADVRQIGQWPVHQYLLGLDYRCCHFHEGLKGFGDGLELPPGWGCPHYANLFYRKRSSGG